MPLPLETARRNPESLKGRILKAARQVFARHGYHAATTRAIAAEVGIDVSTLYYHWGSKQDLFDGVLQDLQQDFEERLRCWVHESRSLPLVECFDLAVTLFDSFFLNRDIVRVVMFSFFYEDFAGKGWAVRSQRQLVSTLRTFFAKRIGAECIPPEFDAMVLSLVASTLALVGSRNHLAAILEVEPESGAYRDLVLGTLRRNIGAFISSLGQGELLPEKHHHTADEKEATCFPG